MDCIMNMDYEVIGDLLEILEREKFNREIKLKITNCDYENKFVDFELVLWHEKECDRIENIIEYIKENLK